MNKIIIASSKKWFFKTLKSNVFKNLDIEYISCKKDFTIENIDKLSPSYIFIPHWSWKIKSEIYKKYECIVFHTAPLPYGRGGSPIQNLILNKFKESPLCALKVSEEIDSGPIYCKSIISLEGNLSSILNRISAEIQNMILFIIKNNPKPSIQIGKIHHFKRLSIKDNELLMDMSLDDIYDRIRMVDSDDYDKAFIIFGKYKIEFKNAILDQNQIISDVKIFNLE